MSIYVFVIEVMEGIEPAQARLWNASTSIYVQFTPKCQEFAPACLHVELRNAALDAAVPNLAAKNSHKGL